MNKPHLMDKFNKIAIGLFACIFMTSNLANAATITFSTDTATMLTGTFSAGGLGGGETDTITATPSNFLHLPNGFGLEVSSFFDGFQNVGNTEYFRTISDGSPDDPEVFSTASAPISDLVGTYTNSQSGSAVNFRIFGVTNQERGTGSPFTGSFEFEIAPIPVPAAVWLFGSGLLGLVGMARRKKAA